MTSPRNTSKADPIEKFLVAAVGGIEAQEAQGQRELVASTVLPFPGWNTSDADFEALGFTFGDKVPGDDLFREAVLPEGWTRRGTNHAMHSEILDERGIARVNVFYKAAFYDRRADMHIINVGQKIARDWIYGDDETLTLNPALTSEELADAKVGAEAYLRQAEEYPDIYDDRRPRAVSFLERLDEEQS